MVAGRAKRGRRRVAKAGSVALYAVTLTVSAAGAAWISRVISRPTVTDDGLSTRVVDPVVAGGEQLVLVFVGSTSCVWSRTPEVRDALGAAATLLQKQAEERQMGFHRIGVVASPSPATGLAFLAEVGDFDEIVAGGRWASVGLLKYVVSDFRGSGVTPQLLVLKRRIGTDGWGVHDEKLLRRLVGSAMISTWVSAGGLLPPLEP